MPPTPLRALRPAALHTPAYLSWVCERLHQLAVHGEQRVCGARRAARRRDLLRLRVRVRVRVRVRARVRARARDRARVRVRVGAGVRVRVSLASLRVLQAALLRNGFRQLRAGGVLVYSTCSFARSQVHRECSVSTLSTLTPCACA